MLIKFYITYNEVVIFICKQKIEIQNFNRKEIIYQKNKKIKWNYSNFLLYWMKWIKIQVFFSLNIFKENI